MPDSVQPYEEFAGFQGLNTVDAPEKIGPQHIQRAVNVNNTIDGRLITRNGISLITQGNTKHSIWSNNDDTICLFVDGTTLVQLNSDNTTTIVKGGFIPGKMYYADGIDRIFLTNGYQIGCLINGVYYDMQDKNNYKSDTNQNAKFPALDYDKVMPMPGNGLEWWNGRLYVIVGDKVFYSDAFIPTQFDLSENFLRFSNPVRMFRGVNEGIWASDDNIRFLAGRDPKAGFQMSIKSTYSVVSGSDQFIFGDLVGTQEGVPGKVLFFSTAEGVCMGGPDGSFRNLTSRKYKYPEGVAASSVFMDANGISRYVVAHQG